MNGYSVEEAAEVLGIPQGRVWELIARGVLAGATEGGASMRVFLKGSPATSIPPEPEADTAANGSGRRANGETHTELSPFRELLTEFRNLTERYGQALLALGEARGEVASLRSRVDLLEARMDMRLPLRTASTVAWEMPELQPQAAPVPERPAPTMASEAPAPSVARAAPAAEASAAPMMAEPLAGVDEPFDTVPAAAMAAEEPMTDAPSEPEMAAASAEPEPRPRRSSSRIAIANLAEALARAEDPALAALPGAQEAADALAALHRQVEATTVEGEPGAEPPPTPDTEPTVANEEPGLLAELDAVAATAPSIELAEGFEVEVPVAEELASAAEAEPVQMGVAEETGGAGEPGQPDAPPAAPAAPESPYSTDVIEPDWFADGDFTWLDAPAPEPEPTVPADAAEPSPPAALTGSEPEGGSGSAPEPVPPDVDDVPRNEADPTHAPGEDAPAAEVHPASEEAPRTEAIAIRIDEPRPGGGGTSAPAAEARISGFGLYRGQPEGPSPRAASESGPATALRDEEALMWFGDEFEAGDLEVAAPAWRGEERRPDARPAEPAQLQLSDAEIDQLASSEGWDRDEVEAIRGLLGRPSLRAAEEAPAPAPAGDPGTGASPHPRPEARDEAPAPRPLPIRPVDEATSADWLRNRRGPAANAYRRLRRIFQG